MLKMIKGCKVKNVNLLKEEYQIFEKGIMGNVNEDKIQDIFKLFISLQNGKLFFILEVPANKVDEELFRNDKTAPFHKNIYYIDGLNSEQAIELLDKFGEILINDGLCNFGFGAHDFSAEIMKLKYNIVSINTKTIDKYSKIFDEISIPQTKLLITAWDTLSANSPGTCKLYKNNGEDIYSVLDQLKNWNIYFAEQTEE